MKAETMPTVTHEARVEDLPQEWRKDFDAGTRVRVTIHAEAEAQSTDDHAKRDAAYQRRKAAIDAAAGLWADRTDEEIDALRDGVRKADYERLDKLIPKD